MYKLLKSAIKRIFFKNDNQNKIIENEFRREIVSTIGYFVYLFLGDNNYCPLHEEVIKTLLYDENVFKNLFGDILKSCIDNKQFGWMEEQDIARIIASFLSQKYPHLNMYAMIYKIEEYFSKKLWRELHPPFDIETQEKQNKIDEYYEKKYEDLFKRAEVMLLKNSVNVIDNNRKINVK